MHLNDLFASFRPLHNPLGFGVADFVLLAVAIASAILILLGAWLRPWIARAAQRTPVAMMAIGALAIGLRLAMLPASPVPIAEGADDLSYILSADTLSHFRLANPAHPFSQFFEAVFVLQHPTYSSVYPFGQGLVLAAGKLAFGTFWAGVLLSGGVFAALSFWMLRGWVPARWAAIGALLAVAEFGPLSAWTNSYWGGFVSASAGCLVFGALPRLPGRRAALLLGIGLGLQAITRPFECVLLALTVGLYLGITERTRPFGLVTIRTMLIGLVGFAPAILVTGLQNRAVTGQWLTMPYLLSRYEYGVPTTFTFQQNPTPHQALTPEQELDYRAQRAIHGLGTDSVGSYFQRLWGRVRFFRFFWLAPLYLALPFFLSDLRRRNGWWVVGTVLIFWLGTNFYPYFFPHYVAAIACLTVLIAVQSLRNLYAWRKWAAGALGLVCGVHFLFWYGLRASGDSRLLPATAYESWDYVNTGDPDGRRAVAEELGKQPGQQLVFVRYGPAHRFAEWIGNAADIDRSRVVWARDLGAAEDEKLMRYFPARHAWLLEPDFRVPKLTPYEPR